MRKHLNILLLFTLSVVFVCACRKVNSDSAYTGPGTSIKPDLTVKITASVAGFITDENNAPIRGVSITSGGKTATTNQYGYFSIKDASIPAVAGFVKAEIFGYFQGFKTFTAIEGKESFVRLKLLPKKETGTIAATVGGTISTTDGAKITLPANGVVIDNGGAAYTGTVHMAVRWLDPTGGAELQKTMPGDLRGIDSSGYMKALETYGMVVVELTSDAGEKLQITSGKQATVSLPIPTALATTAPASIPFWSFDETNGLWKEEGVATKVGNNYVGQAGHFSSWNFDYPNSGVIVNTRIESSSRKPVQNVLVEITTPSRPNSLLSGYTDAEGNFSAFIPQNTSYKLAVLSDCHNQLFAKDFNTTTTNYDIGTLSVTNSERLADITGAVVDCNNKPVTDGSVFLVDNSSGVAQFKIINGGFSGSMNICTLTGDNKTAVAVDNTGKQQSIKDNIIVMPGQNNLGKLTACGMSTEQSINCTIDDKSFSIPVGECNRTYIIGGPFTDNFGNILNVFVYCYDNLSIGSHEIQTLSTDNGQISFRIGPANVVNVPVPPLVITEFGAAVNEFVSGYVKGSFFAAEVANPTPRLHTINLTFRVRRTF